MVFFRRTFEFWLERIKSKVNEEEGSQRLTGKELRRLAFGEARQRFELLLPLCERLNAIEEEQRLAEESLREEQRERERFLAMKKAREKKKKDG